MHFNKALIDFRAEANRKQLRCMTQSKQKESIGRMALHLSTEEYESLCANNPDTLAHPTESSRYWKDFVLSSDSAPYKIRSTI